MQDIVSTTMFVLESASGERTDLIVRIGTPAAHGAKGEEWRCQYEVCPPMSGANRAIGEDSLQSLILATYAALNVLKSLIESGNRIIHSTGERVPLEAYDLTALAHFESIGESLGDRDT